MEISISKKALFTALEAVELIEENHQDNVYCMIGDRCRNVDAMRELIENKELRDKELTSDDVLEIKWEIDLLETLAEIKSILYKTYPKDCFTR